jgi:hypothetical protein
MLLIFLIMSAMGLSSGEEVDAAVDVMPDAVGDALGDTDGAARYEMLEDTAGSGSSIFFHMLSFRSIVAAVAFFGIGGRIVHALAYPMPVAILAGATAGMAALFLVGWLMQMLYSLREEGNVQVVNTLGAPANVYLAVPGERSGVGKVSLTVQNRSMEYDAMTDGELIPTGSRVVVAEIINDNTLLVKRGQEGV